MRKSDELSPIDPPKSEVDLKRRDALIRMAKYTAPAMLALLASSKNGMAIFVCTSACV